MTVRILSWLTLLVACPLLAGEPSWITLQNENFIVYSTANAQSTREAVSRLERVRKFFALFDGQASTRSAPISVVIFGNEKEFQPYKPNEVAIAYYASHSDRDFIVFGKLGEQAAQVAAHEYAHLRFRRQGYELPPWLNEGLADLYSTLSPHGQETEYGNIIPGRLYPLTVDNWVPLETILTADQSSPYYNETKRAGSLYNESWALVHMLATSEQYRHKFSSVVRAINAGMPSVKALETAYGVPLADIESALRTNVLKRSLNHLLVPVKLDDLAGLPSQPARPFDVREVQAELMMGLKDRVGEAQSRFEQLARDDAARPEPWANLAYLSLRAGNDGRAVDYFAKAYELGDRYPRFLFDCGRIVGTRRPEVSIPALKELLEMEPTHLDARLVLGNLQLSAGRPALALEAVSPVNRVRTVEQRDMLFYLRAYGALRIGDAAAARVIAQELKKVSTSDAMVSDANEILAEADRTP